MAGHCMFFIYKNFIVHIFNLNLLPQVLCLIGEAFENAEDICGAVVNVRPKGDKICKYLSKNVFLDQAFKIFSLTS